MEEKEEGKENGRAAISDMEMKRPYLLELDTVWGGVQQRGEQGEWEFKIN